MDTFIHGPFNFATINKRKSRDRISQTKWDILKSHCHLYHNLAFSRNMASGRNKLIELIMAFGLNKLIKLNNIGPTRSIVKSIGLSLFGYFALADL